MDSKLSKLKKRFKISEDTKAVLYEIGLFALGVALMSVRFLFGTYPFGIALGGACRRHAPFVLAGAAVSVILFMEGDSAHMVALIGLLGLRIAGSFIGEKQIKKAELGQRTGKQIFAILFCESRELRVCVSALVALGLGIYRVVAGGYAYYDVFALVFYTVLVSLLTFCLCGLFDDRGGQEKLLGVGTLLFAIVYMLSGKEIQGIDIVLLLSYCAVLYISKNMGGIYAGIFGFAFGVAQGGGICGVLGICGVVSGFLWAVSPYLAVFCSFVLSLGYAVSLLGYEAIVYLLPELLMATVIMYPLLKFELLPKVEMLTKKEEKGMELYRWESASETLKSKLKGLVGAYRQVASTLKESSQRGRGPDKGGYLDMALEICEAHCCTCPKAGICWDRDTPTTQKNIDRLGEASFLRHSATRDDVEEKFLHRCPNIEKIIDELNKKSEEALAFSVKNDKLECCAVDYDATAKIISHLINEKQEQVVDRALTDKAVRTGAKCGLVCGRIEVMGKSKKRVVATGVDIQRSKCTSLELRQEMEKALGFGLKDAETEESDGYVVLTMERENQIRVDACVRSVPMEKGGANGDSYACFEKNGWQYMAVCDGMGSGEGAHRASQLCAQLLSELLGATEDKSAVVSILNNLVRAKGTECSSTLDLFALDLISGQGCFVKSGACPSFIKRGNNVFKLQSKTAPIGIMKRADAEELAFSVEKGDICVLVSDGVIASKHDVHWVMQYITEYKGEDAQGLADGILNQAKKRGIKDDLTVLCAVIS